MKKGINTEGEFKQEQIWGYNKQQGVELRMERRRFTRWHRTSVSGAVAKGCHRSPISTFVRGRGSKQCKKLELEEKQIRRKRGISNLR
ncbi:hypothetical protein ACLOJK_004603 [Asimina triloba]